MAGRFFYLFTHLIIAIEVENVSDQVESILVVLDVGIEACEVKAVGEIVFVNFAEVLVSARRDELRDEMSVIIESLEPSRDNIY